MWLEANLGALSCANNVSNVLASSSIAVMGQEWIGHTVPAYSSLENTDSQDKVEQPLHTSQK